MSTEKETRISLKRTSSTFSSCCQKAIRVKFFRNGDRYFTGFTFPINFYRYKEFDNLLKDLSSSNFCDSTILPFGVRFIFSVSGLRIKNVTQMEEGGGYVCSSSNLFISLDYLNETLNPKWKTTKKFVDDVVPLAPLKSQRVSRSTPSVLSASYALKTFAKIITIIRNGTGRPRQIFQWLLNSRTAPTFGKVLDDLSVLIKLDSGSVKHIYNSEGKEMCTVEDLFSEETVLIAFGSDMIDRNDLLLSSQELNMVEKVKRPYGKSCGEPKEDFSEPNGLLKLTEKYLIGNEIGVGSFAVVKECKEKKKDVHMALKIIEKKRCEKNRDKLDAEITILKKIRHLNVISFISKFDTNDYIYMVLELCPDGNMVTFLLKNKSYSEQDVSGMMQNIACGVNYLHSIKIIHRDIKFENILVQRDQGGIIRLRICDFGLASQVNELPLFSICGTPYFMAPEIISQAGYDFKVDIWSMGVMLYVLLTGSPPFSSDSRDFNEIFVKILVGNYEDIPEDSWNHISPEAKGLLNQMLERDPRERYSAKQILNYPWVSEDEIAWSIDLWPYVNQKLTKFLTKFGEYSKSHPFSFLAKTALDKESNYFETIDEQ